MEFARTFVVLPLLNSALLTAKSILLEAKSGVAKSMGLRRWFLNLNLSSHTFKDYTFHNVMYGIQF